MRWLHPLTSALLTVMMLVLSYAGARCEAICEFGSFAPACHGQVASAKPESGASMSGMPDCGKMSRAGKPLAAKVRSSEPECVHQVCKQDVGVVRTERSLKADVAGVQAVAIVAALSLDSTGLDPEQSARDALPARRSISPVRMWHVLRV
jgi:hypothetical protein